MKDELDAAVAAIRSRTDASPAVGVVLGSGLGGFADALEDAVEVPYEDIPGWPVATAIGHAGTLVIGSFGGVPVAVMRGRAHLYEGLSPAKVVFGVRVLGLLGIRTLVLTNAVGAIDDRLEPGQLALISDHINLQGQSPLVGPNDESLGPRFPDMSDAYDPELRAAARQAASRLGLDLGEGVYAAWLGPAFETPAEIRMLRTLGADLVGMSVVPEVLAARHMGIRCLAISCVDEPRGRRLARADRPRAGARDRSARGRLARFAVAGARSYTFRMKLSELPSVDELLRDPRLAAAPHGLAVDAARAVLDRAREEIRAGRDPGELAALVSEEIAAAHAYRLRSAVNATGVIAHTNLGRAPLAAAALERVDEVGRGYSNLEYDLAEGRRGSRQDHVAGILRRLTGAEAALVVNNNAAAVLLALAALAEGREVLVSRGELIEIGDGFRIPDVLARSGARLVEVGTTNRTRAADYETGCRPGDRRAAARAPVELPRARLHRPPVACASWRTSPPLMTSRSSTTSARARSCRSATSRRRARASPPARASCASPATSCWAGHRRGSSSARRSSWRSCGAIPSSARCGPTSSRSPHSRAR